MPIPACRAQTIRRAALLCAASAACLGVMPAAQADRGVRLWGSLPPLWVRSRPPAPPPLVVPRPGIPAPHHRPHVAPGWWIIGAPWLLFPPYYDSPPRVSPVSEAPLVLPDLPPLPQNWYFCEASQSYYPYAPSCEAGWRSVSAAPPGSALAAPADGQNWYYCDSANGYYPYVARCAEAWRPVPATPPPAEATPPDGAQAHE